MYPLGPRRVGSTENTLRELRAVGLVQKTEGRYRVSDGVEISAKGFEHFISEKLTRIIQEKSPTVIRRLL